MVGLGERKRIFGKKELRMEKFISGPIMILLGIILIFIIMNNLNGPKLIGEFFMLLISVVLIAIGIERIYSALKKSNKKK